MGKSGCCWVGAILKWNIKLFKDFYIYIKV
jgi:hypothetical protein